MREDFSDLHDELFAYFSNKPDRMLKLSPREFEILKYEAFRNQGFGVHLGPRSGDGGVDVRMFRRDPIGDVLTAIQIKRYRPDRKIGLQAIQALHGAETAYSMEESMFVTTSDYLPGAKAFAARENVSMQLRTSSDVIEWCRQDSQGIIENKAQLVSSHHVKKKLRDAVRFPRQYIVYASTGITVTMNAFALVLKETKHAVLLMELPTQVVDDDGHGQRGSEVPVFDQSALNNHKPERVFRAKKKTWNDGHISYWTGQNSYFAWDGLPRRFDYCD